MLKNKKGFTLVELLAVIVVLAIILIFAVPIVQRVMRNAQENAFLNYANRMLNLTEQQWQLDGFGAGTAQNCYTMEMLDMNVTGSYQGIVEVRTAADGTPTFVVTLTDGNRSIARRTARDIDQGTFETLSHTPIINPNNVACTPAFLNGLPNR